MTNNELREYKPCILCGSEEYRVYRSWPSNYYDREKYETASWDGRLELDLQIVKCAGCDLIYTAPSFKKDSLHHVYPEDVVPENLDKTQLLKETKWNEIIEEIDNALPKGSLICDVGTRYGVFVEKLKQNDFNSFGIELNKQAVDQAHALGFSDVYVSDIESLKELSNGLQYNRVNAFVLDDVLEHLINPVKELTHLSELQEKGDFLFLRQMNHNSWGRKLFGKKWYYYQPAAHMYFFDDQSVHELLSKIGYSVVKIRKGSAKSNLKRVITTCMKALGLERFKLQMKGTPFQDHYLNRRHCLDDMFLVIAVKN